jgi:hypothetical protein
MISMASASQVQIASTGFYQVTFGVGAPPGNAILFGLSVNGATVPPQQLIDVATPAGALVISQLTVIIQATTNPTFLTIVNNSGSTFDLNNNTASAVGGPAAYMTITKIK